MNPACKTLVSLIQDEEIGIHEYISFISKYANTEDVLKAQKQEELEAAINNIIKQESSHGLKLINLLPIFCSEEDLDVVGRENIREMRDYFLKQE